MKDTTQSIPPIDPNIANIAGYALTPTGTADVTAQAEAAFDSKYAVEHLGEKLSRARERQKREDRELTKAAWDRDRYGRYYVLMGPPSVVSALSTAIISLVFLGLGFFADFFGVWYAMAVYISSSGYCPDLVDNIPMSLVMVTVVPLIACSITTIGECLGTSQRANVYSRTILIIGVLVGLVYILSFAYITSPTIDPKVLRGVPWPGLINIVSHVVASITLGGGLVLNYKLRVAERATQHVIEIKGYSEGDRRVTERQDRVSKGDDEIIPLMERIEQIRNARKATVSLWLAALVRIENDLRFAETKGRETRRAELAATPSFAAPAAFASTLVPADLQETVQ